MSYYDAPLPEYQIAEFDGGNCPVCGAAGGNCTGESLSPDRVQFTPPKPSYDPGATFTVAERVYEEVPGKGSRTRRKLIYPKGARIRPEEAKRLGLLPPTP